MQIQVKKFNKYMEKIEKISFDITQWLNEMPLKNWILAYDSRWRFETMITNLSEYFNRVLKNAHFLTVILLLQLTFFCLVAYFDGRHTQAENALNKSERFTSFIITRMSAIQSKATFYNVTRFDKANRVFKYKWHCMVLIWTRTIIFRRNHGQLFILSIFLLDIIYI